MDATATLTVAGWTRKRDYFTHADSPDSKIFVNGRNWKHTAFGVEQLSSGIFASRNVTISTGRSLHLNPPLLFYQWHRAFG